jgi:hypothetical protein
VYFYADDQKAEPEHIYGLLAGRHLAQAAQDPGFFRFEGFVERLAAAFHKRPLAFEAVRAVAHAVLEQSLIRIRTTLPVPRSR